MAKKASSSSSKGKRKVEEVMKEHMQGTLKSGSGKKSHKSQAGGSDRFERGAEVGREDPQEEEIVSPRESGIIPGGGVPHSVGG